MPSKKHSFNMDEDEYSKLLNDDNAAAFYHVVSKVVYISKLASLDIKLEILYLCTRVFCITDGEWEN